MDVREILMQYFRTIISRLNLLQYVFKIMYKVKIIAVRVFLIERKQDTEPTNCSILLITAKLGLEPRTLEFLLKFAVSVFLILCN